MIVNGVAYPVIYIEGNANNGYLWYTLTQQGQSNKLLCYNPRTDAFEFQTADNNDTMQYIIDAAGYREDSRVIDEGGQTAPASMTKEMITFKV